MDKIIIKNLKFYAYHGVNEEEKEDGQQFELDIECFLDLTEPCLTDDIDDTVSYAKIIKRVRTTFLIEKNDLIERAAHRVADEILKSFPKIESVKVCLRKPDAPIQAEFDYVAVEITVDRKG